MAPRDGGNGDALVYVDAEVMDGLPVIRGTRIPVWLILELLEAGYDETRIHHEYPTLPPGSVRAALGFGARLAARR